MITQKQIEASRARAKALQDESNRAADWADAEWRRHDGLATAYYRQVDQQRKEAEGEKGPA